MEQYDQDLLIQKIRLKISMLQVNQSQLARMAGITPGALTQILRKDRAPSTAVLAKLANALGVSMDFLLGRTSESQVQDVIQHDRAKQLVSGFSELPAKDQQRVLDFINGLKSTAK